MSVKEIFDMVYAILVVLAIIVYCVVTIYDIKHKIKNKWIADIPNLATGFVHEAETTGDSGKKKMNLCFNRS